MKTTIFVFGSNLAGRHGKGAALYAKQYYGAIYGQGAGLQGNSYAIPTKDGRLRPLPLNHIKEYIRRFIVFASSYNIMRNKSDVTFKVTAIGCGLAGYKPEDIAPFFKIALDFPNIMLPDEFLDVLLTNRTKCTPVANSVKSQVWQKLLEGHSQRKISQQLKISQASVCNIRREYINRGGEIKAKPINRQLLSEYKKNKIKNLILKGDLSTRAIAKVMNVSQGTVCNISKKLKGD